jgi:hypothetical protein
MHALTLSATNDEGWACFSIKFIEKVIEKTSKRPRFIDSRADNIFVRGLPAGTEKTFG